MRGVERMTALVGPTLGPRGRHVVLQRFDAPPLVTNDGVTIARSVDMLQDPITNQGVQLLRVHDIFETVQALRVWRGQRDEALTPF